MHCVSSCTFPSVPSEPQSVILSDTGNILSWRQPSQLHGEELTGYEVLASTNSNKSSAEVIDTLPASATSYNIPLSKLEAGFFFFWVRIYLSV